MTRLYRASYEPLKRRGAVAAIVLIGVALIAGSSIAPGNHAAIGGPLPQRPTPQGKGKFKTLYIPVKNKAYTEMQDLIVSLRLLEELAADFNDTIAIPVDITLTFGECGEVNAFYRPDKHQIIFCYEYLEELAKIYAATTKSDEELGTRLTGSIFHTFFHELGHALIHVLDLPVTGKEEDAVDQLATVILVEAGEDGEKAVLNASLEFLANYQAQSQTRLTKSQFADEHALDAQRFYNLLCWVYGHNEKKYAYLVNKGMLPKERAERCADEYDKIFKSWSRLLDPYMKK